MPRWYHDLRRALDALRTNDTPWTPPVSLIAGLDAALEMIRQEGIENVWRRHHRLACGLRACVKALGFELFSESPSDSVTAIRLPAGLDGKRLRAALKERDGITIAGGQGAFADSLIRIAHLGYYDDLDMIAMAAALERALISMQWPIHAGAGVAAAQRELLAP